MRDGMSIADGFLRSRPRTMAGQSPAVIPGAWRPSPGAWRPGWAILVVVLCAAVGAVVGVFAEQPWYRATTLVQPTEPVPFRGVIGVGPSPGVEERRLRQWQWLAHSPDLAHRVAHMHHGIGAVKLGGGFHVSQ